jgi:dipeptidyl aminopeptidase/acylaminoacyl peptidase
MKKFDRISLLGAVSLLVVGLSHISTSASAQAIQAQSTQPMRQMVQSASRALTIQRIAADRDLFNVVISRDGKHVAGIAGVPGKNPIIRVWSTDNLSAAPVQIGSTTMRFTGVSFVKNDRLLITANQPVSMGADSNWVTTIAFADIEGKKVEEVTTQFSGFQLLSPMAADPNFILVEATDNEGTAAMKFNVRTGASQRVARLGDYESFGVSEGDETGITATGMVDATGYLRMKTDLIARNGTWFRRIFWREVGGNWIELTGLTRDIKQRFDVEPLALSSDGKKLFITTNRNTDFSFVAQYDIPSQTLSEPMFQNTEFDATGIVFWRPTTSDTADTIDDDVPTGFCFSGPSRECVYTEPTLVRIQNLVEQALPGRIVRISPRSAGKIVMVTATAPNSPSEYFVLKNENQLIRLGSAMEGVDRKSFGSGQWVNYPARDGLNIPSVLYLPPGYDKARDGRLPLVVMPHGGPWSRDSINWDGSVWPQMFASRGFAVLQPNYRGSLGLGARLWKAGDKEWGGKMQDDKDDGARWLVSEGIADPNRMMMYGYSYGGFAAAAAAARSGGASAGLWQCAISGAPAIDLERIGNDWGASRIQRLTQGVTVDGWDPMEHLQDVKIPWLIFHGDYDRQADTIHSRTAAARMRQVNPTANFRYVEIPKMSHQLIQMTEAHRVQFVNLIFDWTSNNCGNISAQFKEPGLTTTTSRRASR